MWELIVLFLSIILIYFYFKNREWKSKFEQRINELLEIKEKDIREDAIRRSARTLSGKTLERFVPFLKDFAYDPHDTRWLGDPIDLVIFDGYSSGDPKQIVLCEVKSGESELTSAQKKIRDLVKNREIKWNEFRIK